MGRTIGGALLLAIAFFGINQTAADLEVPRLPRAPPAAAAPASHPPPTPESPSPPRTPGCWLSRGRRRCQDPMGVDANDLPLDRMGKALVEELNGLFSEPIPILARHRHDPSSLTPIPRPCTKPSP